MSSLRRGGVRVSMLAVAAVLAVAGAGLSAVPAAGQPQPDTTAAQVSPAVEPAAPAASASRAAAAAPAPASADLRGDIVSRRGVPVRNVTVSSNGAAVTATVYWNQQMIARKGNRDRFNVRLAAFGAGGAEDPIVLKNRSKKKRPPAVQKINIKLSKKKAKKLRSSDDVVLAVSQQYGLKGTHHNRYFRQYVTVTKIKAGSKTRVSAGRGAVAASTRAGRDCSTIEIKPGANLSGCDLSRANISICDLADVNLSGANLSGAILNKCNLSGAQLAGADLAGVRATGITGTPASLPDGWALVNGVLTTTGPRPPPATFTVTYDGNTSTGGAVPTDGSSPYATGSTVTVAGNTGSLVKTGNTFNNWNTAANGSGTSYAPAATFTISADTVLYAQWTVDTFTVTYDGNTSTGGAVPTDGSSPYATGSTVTVAGNTGSLVKTGNTFNNWNTAANGSGTSYAPAATFTISADTVLYAQWTAAASCATGGGAAGTCVVGDTGPGGGEVFYVNESNLDGSRYMEAVVAGMSPAWDDTNGGNYYQWCAGTGQTNNVVTGTAIGSGKTNTDNMVTACTSGAANSVRAYTGGGLPAGSWSLPSLDELNALDVSGVGGLFASHIYWSSSQDDASLAWFQGVGLGGGSVWQYTDFKDSTFHVRPVRAF